MKHALTPLRIWCFLTLHFMVHSEGVSGERCPPKIGVLNDRLARCLLWHLGTGLWNIDVSFLLYFNIKFSLSISNSVQHEDTRQSSNSRGYLQYH